MRRKRYYRGPVSPPSATAKIAETDAENDSAEREADGNPDDLGFPEASPAWPVALLSFCGGGGCDELSEEQQGGQGEMHRQRYAMGVCLVSMKDGVCDGKELADKHGTRDYESEFRARLSAEAGEGGVRAREWGSVDFIGIAISAGTLPLGGDVTLLPWRRSPDLVADGLLGMTDIAFQLCITRLFSGEG